MATNTWKQKRFGYRKKIKGIVYYLHSNGQFMPENNISSLFKDYYGDALKYLYSDQRTIKIIK